MTLRYDDPSFDALEATLEKQYNLPRGLMSAIRTRGETSHNNQVSPKGAKGVYQFMPKTWVKFADPGTKPTDPEAAATAAARYLAYGMELYGGDVGATAAEYNGGPKAAKAYLRTGNPGNKETRKYVQRVLGGNTGKAPIVVAAKVEPVPALQSIFGDSEDLYRGESVAAFTPTETPDRNFEDGFTVPDMDSVKDTELENEIGRIVDEVLNG